MSLLQNSQPIKIFFSYVPHGRKDKNLFDELLRQLSPLKQQGYIEEWYDSMTNAGANWQQSIDIHIYGADIIVFLISPAFLASEYCCEFMMKQIFERYEAGAVRILSVLLRPIDWLGPFLEKSPLLPADGKPIGSRSNRDRALAEVARVIRGVVEELINQVNARVRPSSPRFPLWMVPSRRNPLFMGREGILTTLHNFFTASQTSSTHIQALNGLGGIGKTQIAIEYAYRYQQEYQIIVWIKADTRELFTADVTSFADALSLPEKVRADEEDLFMMVRQWLQCHQKWLLLLDNLADFSLIDLLIPPQCGGHVLLTTRLQATGAHVHAVAVAPMSNDESVLFLLRRSKIIDEQASQEAASTADYTQALSIACTLDGFPLALDQAGAYIEETRGSLSGYLSLYQQHRARLLQQRGQFPDSHPQSVTTTLSLAFEQINQVHPGTLALLRLFSFLHPDLIPDEMIIQGAPDLPPPLQTLAADPLALNDAIALLLRFSLIHRRADTTTSSIHRIVQAVLRDSLSLDQQRQWAIYVVHLVNRAFPTADFCAWPVCQRYLPQAQMCAQLITDFALTLNEAAQLLHNLGTYCYERVQYTEAEKHLSSALHLREQTLGFEHIDTADTLNALALLYHQQGSYQQAEFFLQRSLSIHEHILGPDHPSTASVLNNLALLYSDQCKFSLAEPLYQSAIMFYEQASEADPSDIANALNNLALLYHEQNKFSLAEPLYQRSLALREAVLPTWHPDLAQNLNNLAQLYQDQGSYSQAEPLLQRALQMREQTLGPEHPDTALSLNNLAQLYQEQENYQQAEPLLKRALEIREQIFGPEHPDTALSLNNLALLYRKQGHVSEAEPLYQRALSIYEQAFGDMHADVALALNNLGRLYVLQGCYQQAEPLLLRAVAIREQVLGVDHTDTALSLGNLAELYMHLQRSQEAESLYQHALAIYRKVFGDNHPEIAYMMEKYAVLLEELERTEEASALRTAAQRIRIDDSH